MNYLAALNFGDFACHSFDLIDVVGVGLAVMLAVGADIGEVEFDVLVGEQNTEIVWDGTVGRLVIEDAVED